MRLPLEIVLSTTCLLSVVRAVAITDYIYMDFAVDGQEIGTVQLGLFGHVVPNTVHTFIQLAAEGIKVAGRPRKYLGSHFHRIVPKFLIQGGDCTHGGDRDQHLPIKLDLANNNLQFDAQGMLSMASTFDNPKGCQFFITLNKAPWLNEKYTAFGKVVNGMAVVRRVGSMNTDVNDAPVKTVTISGLRHVHLNVENHMYIDPTETPIWWIKFLVVPVVMTMIVALCARATLSKLSYNDGYFDEYAENYRKEEMLLKKNERLISQPSKKTK